MNHLVAKCKSHKLCSRACPDFILQEIWTRTQFCRAAKSNTGANSSKRRSEWPQNQVIWEKIWKRCWHPDFFHLVQLRKPWIFCGLHCPNSKASPKNGPTNVCFYPEKMKQRKKSNTRILIPFTIIIFVGWMPWAKGAVCPFLLVRNANFGFLQFSRWDISRRRSQRSIGAHYLGSGQFIKLTCFLRRKIIQIKAELSIANSIYSWG